MAKFYLYDWKNRENVAVSSDIEICLLAALRAYGKYEVVVADINEVIKIEEDSLLNTYVPETVEMPGMRVSSAFGWKFQLWLNGKEIWAGSMDESVFQDAYDAAKYGEVQLLIWPVNGDGLPLGF